MPASDIVIKGAREHNLRDVDLVLPRNQLICLTGVSGSGKSSLAFDTLFAEGQRRYVESLSSFARQFLGQMPKPDVDLISGLSPSISISQKSSGKNPRSTVGTITEIYDFLRVLYARVGQGYCPKCDRPIAAQSRDQIIASILKLKKGTKYAVLAPLIRAQKGEHRDLFSSLVNQGFVRVRVDNEIRSLSEQIDLDRSRRHNIEVVVDRLESKKGVRGRLSEAVELGLKLGKGTIIVAEEEPAKPSDPEGKKSRRKSKAAQTEGKVYSSDYACVDCGLSFAPPTPQMFSFNSPQGMCGTCDGMGELFTFDPELLIPDPGKSFQQGCFELIGKWRSIGRWRRHIYQGVADTIERVQELEPGTMLETAWEELPEDLQDIWLYGSDQHITYTWRGGSSPMKYGGQFDGIVSELDEKYRSLKSAPQLRKLEDFMNEVVCSECEGDRLNNQARHFRLRTENSAFADQPELSLPQVSQLSIDRCHAFFEGLELDETRQFVAVEPLKEIRNRLGFLLNVGLNYLTLDRTAPTLSGGESQRIRLAGQIGAGLVGVLYILDEPSIGLHPRDNDRLIDTLGHLRDLGNTVIVVEHDEDTMRASDYLIDFGPGPGIGGGEVVAQGHPSEILDSKRSLTAQYLSGRKTIDVPNQRRKPDPDRQLIIKGARHNNLKGVDVEIPLGAFVCVTGVSGSGKSSLVNDILSESLREELNKGIGDPGDHDEIVGIDLLDKMIAIDQSPIGRTPRSNPGTYIKLFDEIRKLYAQMPDAKRRGYTPGRFSFNVKKGRCQACEGNGSNKLEMDFLADVWVTCPVCEGKRFNRETLQIKYKDKSIADVLEMDVRTAIDFFQNIPKILERLKTLDNVGLGYLQIGQPSPTLSGGEAQRIKLARELVKKSTGSTLYLLDEPTTGLHFADISLLLNVLQDFVAAGNTVLVVEHNLDVIKTADWIIDIGPDGGAGGGRVVASGPPEEIAKCKESYTGQAIAKALADKADRNQLILQAKSEAEKGSKNKRIPTLASEIKVTGAEQHNLKSVDLTLQRDKMTVFCGPSGSGKSSLAMDTIYAEGQRRYVESLSSYARQFVNQLEKPKVDQIEGLSPAIAIEQKNLGSSPRSTVGTVTEVYDYLRILFSRLGEPYCPDCDRKIGTQTSDQVVDKILKNEEGAKLIISAPFSLEGRQDLSEVWPEIKAAGYIRVRVNDETYPIEEAPELSRRLRQTVEVVVDRIVVNSKSRSRIADSVEAALSIGAGVLYAIHPQEDVPEKHWRVVAHSQHLACEECGRSFEMLTPHNFSFNSRLGWCPDCEGLGTQMGANPAVFIRDADATLEEGAIVLWPGVGDKQAKAMLKAWCQGTGIPQDRPLSQLDARQRRMVFYGTQDRWFDVRNRKKQVLFSFQYKGVFPAMDEAARLVPAIRNRLDNLISEVECGSCGGSRLREDAGAVRYREHTIDGLCRLPLGLLTEQVLSWKLNAREQKIAGELIREVQNRIQFLNDVGLEYITLSRTAGSLSNGEAQRIRLASQLGSGLCGVLYVLDEPTIGLHPRDNTKLLSALHRLRDLGNTLIVVEHDREVIEHCDSICDFGPVAGAGGGQIVAEGTQKEISKRRGSVTGPYLSGKKAIAIPSNRRPVIAESANGKTKSKTKSKNQWSDPPVMLANSIDIMGARHNNLKNIDVQIPLGSLTVVTGPSGCGKSSLINGILYNSLAKRLHRAQTVAGDHDNIRGLEYINKVIRVDQNPLGNSPSSNPATYTGAFELIRTLFAQLPDAKIRGYTSRRFSFNVPGGRCEECFGNGQICIEMHFLPDVWVECETCKGRRYNEETLAVRYQGHSINDVLNMSCGEAAELFKNIPKIRRILSTLCDVGLDYVTLGQSAPTLSGGEAQRVKLAAELARPDTGRTLYLLDEPTTGLHFDDLQKLLNVLQRLVDLGNSVLLIEHNLDIIKAADWVIDLGPEAGQGGGQIVVQGTPEMIVEYAKEAKVLAEAAENENGDKSKSGKPRKTKSAAQKKSEAMPRSWTGEALTPVVEAGPYKERKEYSIDDDRPRKGDLDIADVGEQAKMPWEADGRRWHTEDRVGRKGEQVKWDGRILAEVVDRIQEHDEFLETNWNDRTIVEITGKTKSNGWFFHAITGEAWFVKLKFRVRPRTFKRAEVMEAIPLLTANEMDDLPVYGNTPRVKVTNLKSKWQEVEIKAHSWEEINIEGFWQMLDTAIDSFSDKIERIEAKVDDHSPWAKLGKKWHLMPKGFPSGRKREWGEGLLESVVSMLQETAPEAEFVWTNKQVVHLILPGQKDPWVSILTKKPEAVWLQVAGPRDSAPLGRVVDFAEQPEVTVKNDKDILKMSFRDESQVQNEELKEFLEEHLDIVKD